MRASTLLVALSAFAAAAAAAVLNKRQGPPCVLQCIALESDAIGCSTSDAPCLCKSETFITQVAGCFATNCTATDADAGVKLGQELCAAVGFTVSIPSAASSALAGTSGAGGASTSAASTTPASGSGASSTAVSNTAASSGASSSAASSPAPASSSAAPAPTSGATALKGSIALAAVVLVGATMSLFA